MPSMLKMSPILEVPHGECLITSGAAGSYEAIILHYNSTVKSPGYIFLCRKRVLCINKKSMAHCAALPLCDWFRLRLVNLETLDETLEAVLEYSAG